MLVVQFHIPHNKNMKSFNKIKDTQLGEFLQESNAIERVYSEQAFRDAWAAWKFLLKYDPCELTLSIILNMHEKLLKNLNNRIAGKLRDCNVRVGYHICPDPTLVSGLLNEWLYKYSLVDTEEDIQNAHIAFEEIHPFEDGNGRVGRIIMNWQRLKAGYPMLIIREGSEQMEYYKWFQKDSV